VPRPVTDGHTPRISQLTALAIRFEQLIQDGVVQDQSDLAHLALVSRARVTQIMDLLMLAPDIQEALLFLPPVHKGRDPMTERDVRRILAEIDWERQRVAWSSNVSGGVQRIGREGGSLPEC
jgi:hypothetical protein